MGKIEIHNGNFAVNVKFSEYPENLTSEVMERNRLRVYEKVGEWLDKLEAKLSKQYPSFEIILLWTGNPSEWISMLGNWNLISSELQETAHRERIIQNYILPMFEDGVNEILRKHYKLWDKLQKEENNE